VSKARHQRAQDLFEEARALPREERPPFLSRACGADTELSEWIGALLASDEERSSSLETPALEQLFPGTPAAFATAFEGALPERIGRYRVLARLGSGGMGVVYEAEQDQPRRRVALKVLRADLVSPEMLRRFELEAEVLGRLDHPGIARIHEAGTADLGLGPQPYFAMELVEGEPLIEHAAQRNLGLRERLDLVARVCDAVQHAHRKGVIHRDLKPSNLLVDRQGRPKVLDFGVARATDLDLAGTTLRTRTGELVGTLPYMSPEQMSGDPAALDTRCDVYALGVLAYELLSGSRPFEVGKRSLAEAIRIVSEEEPTRLGLLRRELSGDVETIVGKALEKDPRRRYGSADELSSDLRRYLADEPISARAPSARYKLTKFVRRNRVLVSGLAGIFLALCIGLAVSALLYEQSEERGARLSIALGAATDAEKTAQEALGLEREARAEAVRQKDRAQATLEELVEAEEYFDRLLAAPTPYADGSDVRVVEVLERTAAGIDGAFPDRPLLRARMLERVGRTYSGLGQVALGLEYQRRAAELFERHGEPATLQMARFKTSLASAHFKALEWEASLGLYRESLALLDGLSLSRSAYALEARQGVVQTLTATFDLAEAEEEVRAAIELAEGLGPAGERGLASCRRLAALVLTQSGRGAEAEATCRDALALLERLAGSSAHETLDCMHLLAQILFHQQRFAEGEELELRSYERLRELIDGDHPDLLQRLEAIAAFQGARGRLDEALATYDEALAMSARLFEGANETHAVLLCSRGWTLMRKGDLAGGEESLRKGIDEQRETVGPDDLNLATSLSNLGTLLRNDGRPSGAIEPLIEALAIRKRVADPTHARIEWDLRSLASAYEEAGDWVRATPLRDEALLIIRRTRGDTDRETLLWTASLASNLLEQARDDEAFELMEVAFPMAEANLVDPLDRAILQADYGACLWRVGQREVGEGLLRDALEVLEARQNEKSPYLQRARRRLAEIELASARQ